MAHCALYQHNSDRITYFIRDCRKVKGSHKDGWDYLGSNCQIRGIKPRHFAEKWTNDEPTSTFIADLSECLRYHDRPVSKRDDVNEIITEEIRAHYSQEAELKMHRLGLMDKNDPEWLEYLEVVTSLTQEGKAFKDMHFKEDTHG